MIQLNQKKELQLLTMEKREYQQIHVKIRLKNIINLLVMVYIIIKQFANVSINIQDQNLNNIYDEDQSFFIFIRFVKAQTCSQADINQQSSQQLTASSSYSCQIASQLDFFSSVNSNCGISACSITTSDCNSYIMQVSSDSNSYLVASPSSSSPASCTFELICQLFDTSTSPQTFVDIIASNTFTVVLGTPSTSNCFIVPAISSFLTFYKSVGNSYNFQNTMEYPSSSYSFKSCLIQDQGGNLPSFMTSSICATTLQSAISLSQSVGLAQYRYYLEFEDSSSSIKINLYSNYFNVQICEYTTVSFTSLQYQLQTTATQSIAYEFTSIFTASDPTNCPTFISNPSISMSPSTYLSAFLSSSSLDLVIQIDTLFSNSYTFTFTFASQFSQGSYSISSSELAVQVVDCYSLSSYITSTVSSSNFLTYYSSDEINMKSITFDLKNKYVISAIPTICTFSTCQIYDQTSGTASPYFSFSSFSSSTDAIFTGTAPTDYFQSTTYGIKCLPTGGSSTWISSEVFTFKFYYCDAITNPTYYLYSSSSISYTYDYYQPSLSVSTMSAASSGIQIIQASYQQCIKSCSPTFSAGTSTSLNTFISSSLTTYTYTLTTVLVNKAQTSSFTVSCIVNVGTSAIPITIKTGQYNLIVQGNCANLATFYISSAASSFTGLTYYSSAEFNGVLSKTFNMQTDMMIYPPSSTCTYSSCSIINQTTGSSSFYFTFSSCTAGLCSFNQSQAPTGYTLSTNNFMKCYLSDGVSSVTSKTSFSFTFYSCDKLSDSSQYSYNYVGTDTILPDYDYYQSALNVPSQIVNQQIVYAKYYQCINSCLPSYQQISAAIVNSALNVFQSSNSAGYTYTFTSVYVQTIQIYKFNVQCSIKVGSSSTSVTLITGYYTVNIAANCANKNTYYITTASSPSFTGFTYYSSTEFDQTTIMIDFKNNMMVNPPSSTCTYQQCDIIDPSSATSEYLTFSSCSSTSQQQCNFQKKLAPTGYQLYTYRMQCKPTGQAFYLTSLQTFKMTFYNCNDLTSALSPYTIETALSWDYDYYPQPLNQPRKTINMNILSTAYPICLTSCSKTISLCSNLTNCPTFTTSSTASSYVFQLTDVFVQYLYTYQFYLRCQINVGLSANQVTLTAGNYNLKVIPNCTNSNSYYKYPSNYSITLNYNQNHGYVLKSNFYITQFFWAPASTCIQSCEIYEKGFLFPYASIQSFDYAQQSFSIKYSSLYPGTYNPYLLCQIQNSAENQSSNTFNITVQIICTDPTSYNFTTPAVQSIFQFKGDYLNGQYIYYSKQKFSSYFTPPNSTCKYYDCAIAGNNNIIFYQSIDFNTEFNFQIFTNNPKNMTNLQLQCNVIAGDSNYQISSSFQFNILCAPNMYPLQQQSIQQYLTSPPDSIQNAIAGRDYLVVNKQFWKSTDYSSVTDSTVCSLSYLLVYYDNQTYVNEKLLTFNSQDGSIFLKNSRQLIMYVQVIIQVNSAKFYFPQPLLINQICLKNSTQVLLPKNFKQLQFFVINPDYDPFFSFYLFTSQNSLCTITNYTIQQFQSSNLTLQYVPLYSQWHVYVNNPYKATNGSQAFLINVTAQGGANIVVFANLTLVPNCTLETINLNPNMPYLEQDSFQLYVKVNKMPVLQINQSSLEVTRVNIYNRFQSKNDYFCKFLQFKIKKVIQIVNQKQILISLTTYQQYFKIDQNGVFTVRTPLTTSFNNYLVYIEAGNIKSVFGGDQVQHLADVSVYQAEYLKQPAFLWQPPDIKIDLLEKTIFNYIQLLPPFTKGTNKFVIASHMYKFIICKVDASLGAYLYFDLNGINKYSQNFTFNLTLINQNSNLDNNYTINVFMNGLDYVEQKEQIVFYNCSARIKSLNQKGLLTIQFNESMFTNFDISLISPQNTNIYVLPAQNRQEDEGFDPFTIQLVWNTVSFQNNQLQLQLNFSNPIEISPLNVLDSIVVEFNLSRFLLVSNRSNMMLDKEFSILKFSVRKQQNGKQDDGLLSSAQQGQGILMSVLAIGILFKIMGQGIEEYLLLLTRPLQLIFHLPLFLLVFPSNFLDFVKILIEFIAFDIFSLYFDWQYQNAIQFNYDLSPTVLLQLNEVGYGNHNAFIGLSTFSIAIILYLFRISIVGILKGLLTLIGDQFCLKTIFSILKKGMFFNFILSVFIEGYFDFIIYGYINLQQMQWNMSGEILGSLFTILGLTVTLVIIPMLVFWIPFFKDKYQLSKQSFKSKYGVLYEDYQYNNKYVRLYMSYFIFRRMIFLCIGILIKDSKFSGVQIVINMLLNLFGLGFVGSIQAQNSRLKNIIEICNELFVCLTGLFMLQFTQWSRSQQDIQSNGQVVIYIIICMIAFNLVFILLKMAKIFFLISKKYFNKVSKYYQKKAKIQEKNLDQIIKEEKIKKSQERIVAQKKNIQRMKIILQKSRMLNLPEIKEHPDEYNVQEDQQKRLNISDINF